MSPQNADQRQVAVASATQKERRSAGPLTEKGLERRALLLRAARTVFEREGFLETRVADIVAEAKVAQGTFYTYFDCKEAVFEEVAQAVVDSMWAAMRVPERKGATPVERVEEANRRYIDAYRRHATVIGLIEQVGTFSPRMRNLRLGVREAFLARVARGIRRSQEQGQAFDDLDPELTGELLVSMVESTCYHWLCLGLDLDEEDVVRTMTLTWTRAIGLDRPDRPAQD